MRFNVWLVLIMLFSNNIFGQISKKVAEIIEPLESYEYIHTLDEDIHKIETEVQKMATADELIFLAIHGKNPYVKAVAIKVLMNLEDKSLLKVFEQSLLSKDTIIQTTGCLTDKTPIAAYFFECIPRNYEQGGEDINIKIRSDLANNMFENNPIDVNLVKYLYNQIPPDPRYYQKIRALVIETQDDQVLFALAKYENNADIELIKSFGDQSFWAIARFPHESFLPFLAEKLNDKNYDDITYATLSYCNQNAADILYRVLNLMTQPENNNNHFDLIDFYDSVNRSECSMYHPMLENIWLSHKILSFEILEHYQITHTNEETADYILTGFQLNKDLKLFSKEFHLTTYEDVKMMVKLLKILKNLSTEKYMLAISKVIKDTDDLEMDVFVYELRDNPSLLKCKADFIQKMKMNESAYGLLIILNGVKKLGDQQLFNDCFEIIKSRRAEFLKSEVWEESLQGFIKENNLKL